MNSDEHRILQRQAPEAGSRLGLATATIGQLPINGLRHKVENGTNGWFIWCGEKWSDADDFFASLCIEHITDYLPQVGKYLDLPPGYRFLIDESGYEDIWFDEALLE